MNSRILISCFAALVFSLSTFAAPIDFRVASDFSGIHGTTSFSSNVAGVDLLVQTNVGKISWHAQDGLGINSTAGYDSGEIEAAERLTITFSGPVMLTSILVTNLFHEFFYRELGYYQLNGDGIWHEFKAHPLQIPILTNGELLIDVGAAVESLSFKAPGKVGLFKNHEFSVAVLNVEPPGGGGGEVPEPSSVLIFSTALAAGAYLVRIRGHRGLPSHPA